MRGSKKKKCVGQNKICVGHNKICVCGQIFFSFYFNKAKNNNIVQGHIINKFFHTLKYTIVRLKKREDSLHRNII